MRKTVLLFLSFLFLATPFPVFAQVLGTSTTSATPQLPPTAEGPGLILPDSPFFFLDQFKQNVRLALAFGSVEKTKTNAAIGGERFAELRFMLDKNNEDGVEIDLLGVSHYMRAAAESLHQAELEGQDVALLAKSLNDNIKSKQNALDTLSLESSPPLSSWALAAADSLGLAKAIVENALPSDLKANELIDDSMRQTMLATRSASRSPKKVVPSASPPANGKK